MRAAAFMQRFDAGEHPMSESTEPKPSRRLPPLCPVCGSGRTLRSRVGLFERLVVLLRYRPYRCDHCKSRFWKFRW